MKLWTRAASLAAQTPDSRNRLVDFLRAASILAVISGHWLLAAPYIADGAFRMGNMLDLASFSRWLSWGFQVMPIFFLVGGYANGVSWQAARQKGKTYAAWLDSRMRRLILPVLPLILAWLALAPLGRLLGIDPAFVQAGSKVALVPIWFLAIYTIIILFVPLTHLAWRRFGFASFLVPAALAIGNDALFFTGLTAVGWLNYLFIWIAVHQLGFAWLDGRLPSAAVRFALGCFGLVLLAALTVLGPYPVEMISMPDAEFSNTLPPKLPLLALAIAQAGFVLAAERPLREWLRRGTPWTATVLLNGMIMTIYLWHSTAMVLMIAVAVALGNLGLDPLPGTPDWWVLRPVWLLVYVVALSVLVPLAARFERSSSPPLVASAPRQILGAAITCFGLALLAYFGLGGTAPSIWLQAVAALTPIAGALLACRAGRADR
jgi:surface polysaccharide O-acyltransferase-like enzyme